MGGWFFPMALVLLLQPLAAKGDPLPPGARARLGKVAWVHGAPVKTLAFPADDHGLLALDETGAVRRWELPHRRLSWSVAEAGRPVTALAASAKGLVALGDRDGNVRLLEANGKEILLAPIHRGAVTALAFTSDGTTLASAGADGRIPIWSNPPEGNRRDLPQPGTVTALAFQPGKTAALLATGVGAEVILWDWRAGREVRRLKVSEGTVQSLTFTPDGATLVIGGTGRHLTLWDVATGQERRSLTLEGEGPRVAAFSPGGQTLYAAGPGRLGAWEPQLLDAIRPAVPRGACALALSPDGRLLAAATQDPPVIHLLDPETLQPCRPTLGTVDAKYGVAFSPGGAALAVVGEGGGPVLWDARRGRALSPKSWWDAVTRAAPQDLRPKLAVGFLTHGRDLLTASGRRFETWNLWDGRCNPIRLGSDGLPEPRPNDQGRPLDVTPDGHRAILLTSPWPTGLHLWDPYRQEAVATLFSAEATWRRVAIAPDGNLVAAAEDRADDPGITLWEPPKERPTHRLTGHAVPIEALAFGPDGQLASADQAGTVRLWDARRGQPLRTLRGGDLPLYAVRFAPDGRTVAAAGMDGTVWFWEPATGGVRAAFRGHRGAVRDLAFAPDGRTLATAGEDGSVLLWDVYDLGPPAAADPAALWPELNSADAAAAFRAVGQLVGGEETVLAFLKKHLRAATPPRQAARAVEVLEALATAEARKLLELAALGPEDAPLTREASAALDRLARRAPYNGPAPRTP